MLNPALAMIGLLLAAWGGAPAGAASAMPAAGLQASQIQLDTQGLPYSWQAHAMPATPYDASQPPGPMGLPEHILITFGVTNPADRRPGDPVMYIIPVAAYEQLWEQAGDPTVTRLVRRIYQTTVDLPGPETTGGMPVLPLEVVGGVNDLAARISYAAPVEASAAKAGYRFVGRFAQDPTPVTNQGLRYIHQGFTNDGGYLVSFSYPVATPALPADAGQVPAEEMEQVAADPSAYLAGKAALLNGLPADQWQPDLATLDALVASLRIADMPANGLAGTAWRWTAEAAGGEGPRPIDQPERYEVTFLGDGTAQVTADCNGASGGYSVGPVGGAHGVVDIALGPMTAAECGPESRSLDFVRGLDAAHDYRTQPGGAQLALELLDGTRLLLAAAITEASLKNLEYRTTVSPSGSVTLANGEHRQPAAPGSATEIVVTLTDPIAFGTLNGQPAAAVVLVTEPGGSGVFYELAAVLLQGGRPVNVATTLLGDRIKVEAIAIQNDQIVVDMVAHAPTDPLCCPTQRLRVTYELRDDQLIQTTKQVAPATSPSGSAGR
jgi:hypothetical protein